jgi:hypothetical protein
MNLHFQMRKCLLLFRMSLRGRSRDRADGWVWDAAAVLNYPEGPLTGVRPEGYGGRREGKGREEGERMLTYYISVGKLINPVRGDVAVGGVACSYVFQSRVLPIDVDTSTDVS